jgi:hypothetical protein
LMVAQLLHVAIWNKCMATFRKCCNVLTLPIPICYSKHFSETSVIQHTTYLNSSRVPDTLTYAIIM